MTEDRLNAISEAFHATHGAPGNDLAAAEFVARAYETLLGYDDAAAMNNAEARIGYWVERLESDLGTADFASTFLTQAAEERGNHVGPDDFRANQEAVQAIAAATETAPEALAPHAAQARAEQVGDDPEPEPTPEPAPFPPPWLLPGSPLQPPPAPEPELVITEIALDNLTGVADATGDSPGRDQPFDVRVRLEEIGGVDPEALTLDLDREDEDGQRTPLAEAAPALGADDAVEVVFEALALAEAGDFTLVARADADNLAEAVEHERALSVREPELEAAIAFDAVEGSDDCVADVTIDVAETAGVRAEGVEVTLREAGGDGDAINGPRTVGDLEPEASSAIAFEGLSPTQRVETSSFDAAIGTAFLDEWSIEAGVAAANAGDATGAAAARLEGSYFASGGEEAPQADLLDTAVVGMAGDRLREKVVGDSIAERGELHIGATNDRGLGLGPNEVGITFFTDDQLLENDKSDVYVFDRNTDLATWATEGAAFSGDFDLDASYLQFGDDAAITGWDDDGQVGSWEALLFRDAGADNPEDGLFALLATGADAGGDGTFADLAGDTGDVFTLVNISADAVPADLAEDDDPAWEHHWDGDEFVAEPAYVSAEDIEDAIAGDAGFAADGLELLGAGQWHNDSRDMDDPLFG